MDEPKNYIERTEDHSPDGYKTRIRTNKIGPKDGSEPLTVIQFSLIDKVRDGLEKALRPYVTDTVTEDTPSLKKIIENHFPSQVLEELRALGQQKSASTVYVVKNLPEIEWDKIAWDQIKSPMSWVQKHTYTAHMGMGIGLACDLDNDGTFPLIRYSNGQTPEGIRLHKHGDRMTSLGGIITDGTTTRFVDMQSLLKEAQNNPVLGVLPVSSHANGPFFSLKHFEREHPDWRKLRDIDEDLEVHIDAHAASAFESLIKRHSQEITVSPGDMVFWSNDGHIFHQAMPAKEVPALTKRLSRAVLGRSYNP